MPPAARTPRLPAAPELRLFGPVCLLTDPALAFADERRFRLAVFLALRNDWVGRDALAALFWPDRPQTASRSNLRKLLMEVRALALPGLDSGPAGLRWRVASDAGALLSARQRGDAAAHAEIAAMSFAAPLQGLSGGDSPAIEAWLSDQRAALTQGWRQAALLHARASMAADPATAAALAERLLSLDPLDDVAAGLLESAWRAQGRALDASRWREAFAQRLTRELGVTHNGIDTSPATQSGADADEHAMLGRDAEVQSACALLQDRRCRLLTLTGPGGVGKSTLALALLGLASQVGADAAFWIALEDIHDTTQVLPRVARELGVAIGPASDALPEVLAHLQGRHDLLIFDNAEHLAGLPALLQRLLTAVSTLRCVVSSRTRLALTDEWLLPVEPLAELPARQLFLRAARAAPARQPIRTDEPALAVLIDLLGRLPLALCLAGAWTRHLPLPALVDQVRKTFDVLEVDASIDEHPAHHSLRATFERSWQFLEPPLRPVLAALSVCVGTVSLESARRVAHAGAAQISALANASLLQVGDGGRVGLHPLLRQFAAQKLATSGELRAAALRRHAEVFADLMAPWKDFDAVDGASALRAIAPEIGNVELAWDTAIHNQEATWLADLTSALGNHYQAHGSITQVLLRFRRAEDLLAAHAGAAPEALCRVALDHAGLNFWLADYAAVERSARLTLRAARVARLAKPKRQALNALALAAMRQGRSEEGATWLGQALELARRDGAAHEVAIFAGNLCGVVRELGDADRAEALALEALQGHRRHGNAVGEVSVLNELALIAHQRGQLDSAFERCTQALELIDRHTMALRRPVMLTLQASVRLDQARADEALALAQASMAEVQRVGARSHAPALHRVLAETLVALDRAAEAVPHLRSAVQAIGTLNSSFASRGLLCSCAALAWGIGRAEQAAYFSLCADVRRPARLLALPRYRLLHERALAALASGRVGELRAQAQRDDSATVLGHIAQLLA